MLQRPVAFVWSGKKKMLSATRALAVPVDQGEADEVLWMSCAEEVKLVCDSFGLALKRAAATKAVLVKHDEQIDKKQRKGSRRRERMVESFEDEHHVQEDQRKRHQPVGAGRVEGAFVAIVRQEKDLSASASLSGERESEAMEMDEPDKDDSSWVLAAFAAARAEVDEIASLVQQMSGRSVDVGELVAPDSARTSALEGRRIVQDTNLLAACFCTDDGREMTTLERLGTLKKWWRLVQRCYSVVRSSV